MPLDKQFWSKPWTLRFEDFKWLEPGIYAIDFFSLRLLMLTLEMWLIRLACTTQAHLRKTNFVLSNLDLQLNSAKKLLFPTDQPITFPTTEAANVFTN